MRTRGGKLLAYLKSCPESYTRSSSHLKGLQFSTLPDGDRNIQRGIDIAPGPDGLPCGHKTTVFGAIPAVGGDSQRLFLKTESHGCRLSTLTREDAVAARRGTGGENRACRLGDVGEAISHGISFIETRGQGGHVGSRKEHLPDRVKTAYTEVVDELCQSPYYKDIGSFLKLSQATVGGYGLRSLRKILDEMKTGAGDPSGYQKAVAFDQLSGNPHGVAAIMKPLEAALAALPPKLSDHPTIRLGNEVILQSADL